MEVVALLRKASQTHFRTRAKMLDNLAGGQRTQTRATIQRLATRKARQKACGE
jgi:hypothetical protein